MNKEEVKRHVFKRYGKFIKSSVEKGKTGPIESFIDGAIDFVWDEAQKQ